MEISGDLRPFLHSLITELVRKPVLDILAINLI